MKSSASASQNRYIWQIPSINKSQKNILCNWFIRNNYQKIIAKDIIKIIRLFLSPNESYTLDEIKHAALSEQFDSKTFQIYGFNWYLALEAQSDYNESILYLHLKTLPQKVEKIATTFTLSLLETNTTWTSSYCFEKSDDSWGWGNCNKLSRTAIQTLDQLTFSVQITLDAVYGIPNDLTQQYIPNDMNQYQSEMQNPLNDKLNLMATRIQSVTKNIREMKNLLSDNHKEIEELKKMMQLIVINNSNDSINKEDMEFKNWVNDTLKLGVYYDIFIKNGIDNLSVMQLITIKELNKIGISKIGHKVKILHEIANLKLN